MDGESTGEIEYIEFPARIVGGGTGNYEIECDVESCQWAEYMVVGISNGAVAGQGAVIVNGNSRASIQAGLDYTAAAGKSLNKDNSLKGMAWTLLASTSQPAPMTYWERITNSEKRVFVRIDAQSSCSMYVSIRFRIAVLKIIPGPSVTAHPDHAHQVNIARSDATRQRLGLEQEITEGGSDVTPDQSRITTSKHLRSGMVDFMKGQH